MKPEQGFSAALAEWCAGETRAHSPAALAIGREAVRDTLACMMAGARDPITDRVHAAALGFGTGESTVAGRRERLSPPSAALVNGTAAHIFDYDDNFFPAAAHASAVLVPALLAVAESRDGSAAELLDAYIVGLEVMGRVGEGVNFEHYERGWHATATLGPLAAAAGVARLLRLPAPAVHASLSLAVSMAGGTKRQLGSMAKPFHAGLAAQHGVMAALLAAEGLEGTHEPLDGRWGFREMFAGERSPGFAAAAAKLGSPLAIEEYGLMTKIYPCCASVHASVDGVIDLMREHRLQPDDIERVDTHVPRVTIDHLTFSRPADEKQARFSMTYGVAVAIEDGGLRLSDFKPGAIDRPNVCRWLPRVRMHLCESLRPTPVPPNMLEPARVCLTLRDGSTLTRDALYAKGVLQNPASAEELGRKVRDCLSESVASARAEAIEAALAGLEGETRVASLTSLLAT